MTATSSRSNVNKLLRIREKANKYQNHVFFLSRCIENNFIPKGLRLKTPLSSFPNSEELVEKISESVRLTEEYMVQSSKIAYEDLLEKANEETENLLYKIFNEKSLSDFQNILEKMQNVDKRSHFDKNRKLIKLNWLGAEKSRRPTSDAQNIDSIHTSSQTTTKKTFVQANNTEHSNRNRRNRHRSPIALQNEQHQTELKTVETSTPPTTNADPSMSVASAHTQTARRHRQQQRMEQGSTSTTLSTSEAKYPIKIKRKNRRFKRKHKNAKVDNNKNNFVVNLSSTNLSKHEIEVLEMGPKFCPVPKSLNKEMLESDVKEGCRKVRLKEFFHDKSDGLDIVPKFYKPTGFEPPTGRNKVLDLYCDTVATKTENFIQDDEHKKIKDNVQREHRLAIKGLKEKVKNRTIRISTADKGGSIVIQDVEKYIHEANRQLDDTTYYEELQHDPTKEITKKSNEIVQDLFSKNIIDEKTKKWALTNESEVECHKFYTLPKIHKSLTNTPGRPIVSGVNGPTEKLSKLVDHWLQYSVKSAKSHIQDTTHMLQQIESWNKEKGPFPENTKLVTIDVVGLYSNIPHDESKSSIEEQMQKHALFGSPPVETVVKVADHVLSNNVFTFENKIYKQVHGTAMGTPMAPTVANLFMTSLEEKILQNSPVPVDPEYWKRFIDDIFLLWVGSEEELERFLEFLNEIHPTIKFTHSCSNDQISFLDISISLKNGFLSTDLFTKPTDSHAYLLYSSCHPPHVKKNLPFSQFLRLRRICSEEPQFKKRCNELEKYLKVRGYSKKIIKNGRKKAESKSRTETLSYKKTIFTSQKDKRVPFVITHNPLNPPIGKWLRDLQQNLIPDSNRMKNVLSEPPIIGQRNCKSLKDFLMPSSLPRPIEPNPGSFKCTRKKCAICEKHLHEGKTFSSCQTKETFTLRGHFTCDTRNVIYLISCAKCNKAQYVGQTQNSLRERFYLHRSHINKNVGTPLTLHFNDSNHTLEDMRCIVIESVNRFSLDERLKRESFWISKLKTIFPYGLNAEN